MDSAKEKARKIIHCVAALRECNVMLSADTPPQNLLDQPPAPPELSHQDMFSFDVDSEYEAPKAPALATPKGKWKPKAAGSASKAAKRTKV
jgi:hypothetical protein